MNVAFKIKNKEVGYSLFSPFVFQKSPKFIFVLEEKVSLNV